MGSIVNIKNMTQEIDERRLGIMEVLNTLTSLAEDNAASSEETSAMAEELSQTVSRSIDTVADLKKEKIYSKTVMHCMNYISCHLNRPVCVTEIAAQVKRNPDYLSSLFKKETGKTISEYVMESRLQAARNMLLDSDCSCAEVSAAFGFSSQSYFTRMFRLYTGETPKKFREKYMQSGL